jgi:hypothetical protein
MDHDDHLFGEGASPVPPDPFALWRRYRADVLQFALHIPALFLLFCGLYVVAGPTLAGYLLSAASLVFALIPLIPFLNTHQVLIARLTVGSLALALIVLSIQLRFQISFPMPPPPPLIAVRPEVPLPGAPPLPESPRPTPPPRTWQLSVFSMPSGAKVYVNGKFAGSTDGTIDIPTGSHKIRISKSGYLDHEDIISVPGRQIHSAELTRQ